VHHDGVGYVFGGNAPVHLRAGPQKGSWWAVSRTQSKDAVGLDVFSLWLDHGRSPKGAAYEYHVLPGADVGEVAGYLTRGGIEVLKNTPALQAVRHERLKLTGAAFYAPGTLQVPGGPAVAVDRSCILLLHERARGAPRVALCKPDALETKTKSVKVTIAGRTLEVKLLTGEHAGKSVMHP
jgi:hypothetical protein